jgi:hypothetical protein
MSWINWFILIIARPMTHQVKRRGVL